MSKFEWTLDNIRKEEIILAPIWATFFFKFPLYYMLDIVQGSNLVQYQGKLMMQPWENGNSPNFVSNFSPPPSPPIFFLGFTSTSN